MYLGLNLKRIILKNQKGGKNNMVIRKVSKKISNARETAAKARSQGFNATINKRKDGRKAVSVTTKK